MGILIREDVGFIFSSLTLHLIVGGDPQGSVVCYSGPLWQLVVPSHSPHLQAAPWRRHQDILSPEILLFWSVNWREGWNEVFPNQSTQLTAGL